MNKKFFITSLLLSIQIIVIFAVNANAKMDRVAVLDFRAKNKVTKTEAQTMCDLFRSALVKEDIYEVLDRNNMDNIFKEMEFQQTGCTDQSCVIEIGKMLNAEYVFSGTFTKLGKVYVVTVEMTDIKSGKIKKTANEKYANIEDSDTAARNLVVSLTGGFFKEVINRKISDDEKKKEDEKNRKEEEKNRKQEEKIKKEEEKIKKKEEKNKKKEDEIAKKLDSFLPSVVVGWYRTKIFGKIA